MEDEIVHRVVFKKKVTMKKFLVRTVTFAIDRRLKSSGSLEKYGVKMNDIIMEFFFLNYSSKIIEEDKDETYIIIIIWKTSSLY